MKNTSNSFMAETHVPLCPSLFTLTGIFPTNPTANGTHYRIESRIESTKAQKMLRRKALRFTRLNSVHSVQKDTD